MRGDGIDETLEGSECAAFHPRKSVVIERLLDGEGGLVKDGQPSPERCVHGVINRHTGSRQPRGPVRFLGKGQKIQPHRPVLTDRDQIFDICRAGFQQRCWRVLAGKLEAGETYKVR